MAARPRRRRRCQLRAVRSGESGACAWLAGTDPSQLATAGPDASTGARPSSALIERDSERSPSSAAGAVCRPPMPLAAGPRRSPRRSRRSHRRRRWISARVCFAAAVCFAATVCARGAASARSAPHRPAPALLALWRPPPPSPQTPPPWLNDATPGAGMVGEWVDGWVGGWGSSGARALRYGEPLLLPLD